MNAPSPRLRMDPDAFVAWAMAQEGRYELHDGEVFAMAPERFGHTRAKAEAWLVLRNALRSSGLRGEVFADGASVLAPPGSVYEPDALLRLGPPLPRDGQVVEDPVVIVEVVSPSSRGIDSGLKLARYFAIPTLAHYLVVDEERRAVAHHRRAGDTIETRVLRGGELALDPPGLRLAVAALFPEPEDDQSGVSM